MHITDEFIELLRSEPMTGTVFLVDSAIGKLDLEGSGGWTEVEMTVLLETYALLEEAVDANLLPGHFKYSGAVAGGTELCAPLLQHFREIKDVCAAEATKLRVDSMRRRFRASLGSSFVYEFSQGDLERVQKLINELRASIAGLTQLEKEHQQRLLRRLEKLQTELHKRVSDLDRLWGLVGDAGVVLAKLGNDAKPIVDRIREIADVVWRTQARAEELPSGSKPPLLEVKSEESGTKA